MDALPREGVDVARSIPDDEQVLVVGGGQALAPQAQGCGLHALDLGRGPQGLGDEAVVLDGPLVQPLEVRLLQPSSMSVWWW